MIWSKHLTNYKDTSLFASAWLHEVIEDTNMSIDEVVALFGKEIRDIVFCVTDGDVKTRNKRKKKVYKKIITN